MHADDPFCGKCRSSGIVGFWPSATRRQWLFLRLGTPGWGDMENDVKQIDLDDWGQSRTQQFWTFDKRAGKSYIRTVIIRRPQINLPALPKG